MKDKATYNANTSDTGWLENELRHVNFKDKRLVDRLIKTSNFLDSKASGTINQSCRSWKDAKGAYRLFSNEKFDIDEVYSSHPRKKREIELKIRIWCLRFRTQLTWIMTLILKHKNWEVFPRIIQNTNRVL